MYVCSTALSIQYIAGHNPSGLVITIEKETTSVQCIGFSSDCYYVMVCIGSEGLIYHVKVCMFVCVLCVCMCMRLCVFSCVCVVCMCMCACVCVCMCVCSSRLHSHSDTQDGKLDTTITGHTGHITCMTFLPRQHDIVVTAAEDRTYMVSC